MNLPVLVIKLGALGDFAQALGPFAAIRSHHVDAPITLLTTAPYADFARASPYFDSVWTDDRAPVWRIGCWLSLRRTLRDAGFARVYDLQTASRSSLYFRLLRPGPVPEWSGIASGCSHPHMNPGRDTMHTLDRQAEQLRIAGIASVPKPDVSWADADIARFGLDERFALLVPGGAAHRPAKRWPVERYAALAGHLARRGVQPVVIGGAGEVGDFTHATKAVDLSGQTDLFDLVALARTAECAVGNDTGPMHLIAIAGCSSMVLYSHASDPALCGQRGPDVTILRRPALTDLGVAEVIDALPAVTV